MGKDKVLKDEYLDDWDWGFSRSELSRRFFSWRRSWDTRRVNKEFIDKSIDMAPGDVEEFTRLYSENVFGVKSHVAPPRFKGCRLFLDEDTPDDEVIRIIGSQLRNIAKFTTGKNVKIDIKTMDNLGSHLSRDKIQLSVQPMFDHRIDRLDRIDCLMAVGLHEISHVKYTLPEQEAVLISKGMVTEAMDPLGLLTTKARSDVSVFVPADAKVKDYHKVYAKELALKHEIMNILEDRRCTQMFFAEYPGYAAYWDKYMQWIHWVNLNAFDNDTETLGDDQILIRVLQLSWLNGDPSFEAFMERYARAFDNEYLGDKMTSIIRILEKLRGNLTFRVIMDATERLYEIIYPEEACKTMNQRINEVEDHSSDISGILADIAKAQDGGEPVDGREYAWVAGEIKSESECGDVVETKKTSAKALDLARAAGIDENKTYDVTVTENADADADFDAEVYRKARELARAIEPSLAMLNSAAVKTDSTYEQLSGEIDEDELYSIGFSRAIFREDDDAKDYSMDVGVLVDESGSMGVNRIVRAKTAALGIFLALNKNPRINMVVYGHSADIGGTGRLNMFRYYDPRHNVRDVNALMGIRARSQNVDGYAIQDTLDEMRKSMNGRSKLLIVISDGEPAAHRYGGDSAIEHVRMVTEAAEASGVRVLQVSVADKLREETMSKMFSEYIGYKSDPGEFGRDIAGIIRGQAAKVIASL